MTAHSLTARDGPGHAGPTHGGAADEVLRLLFDETAEGLLLLDGALCVARMNAAAERMLGPTVRPGSNVFAGLAGLAHAARCRGAVAFPVPNAAPIRVAPSPLRAGDGGMLLRLSDAIDLRMAGAVHDLNNLLAVVLHAVEAIVPVAGQEEDLQAIAAAARRGQAMVRGLLSPEAVDAEPFAQAPVEMPPATHALDGLVNDLRGTLLHACGASVGLRIEPAAPDAAVTIDPTVLERVLLNLVVNARDAMTGGGVVVVRSHAPSPEIAVIEVRDDGPGIAPEVIARMGEPFFTTKPAGAGTGLGLATVRRLLAEAGGSLSIASTPGEGTCVSVRLAATPGREPTAASHAGTGGAGAGRAVLLVEDDAAQRRLVARALTSQGWMVLPAASAEEALALAGEAARDLAALVTDLALPGMDGEALARAARQKAGRMALPVVLVSGFAAAATQPESYTARLVKPYAMRDLGQVLAALAPDGEG